MNQQKNDRGYTLIEILFALFIGALLTGAAYVAMTAGQRSSANVERKVVAQQDARAALDLMAMEIGMASYNPNFIFGAGFWVNPANCSSAGTQAYKGIQAAAADSISVEMDLNENSRIYSTAVPPGQDGNEIISYVYDTNNQRITRQTNCGGAQSFLGDAAGNFRSLRVVNSSVGIPVFRYFDGRGTEIQAAALPASIPNIRRIQITLVVDTEEPDPDTGLRRRMVYSTSALPRNHPLSP